MSRLTTSEKANLISKGKISEINSSLTKTDKYKIQYEFKKYNQEVINFILTIPVSDINFEYHVTRLDQENLKYLLKQMKKSEINIDKLKLNINTLYQLYKVEAETKDELLTNKERTLVFNQKLSYDEADLVFKTVFNNVIDEKQIIKQNDRQKNFSENEDYYHEHHQEYLNHNKFKIINEQLKKNIKKLSKKYDLDLIKSYEHNRPYIYNSLFVRENLMKVMTSQGIDFNELFKTLKPIFPTEKKLEKETFAELIKLVLIENSITFDKNINSTSSLKQFYYYLNDNKIAFIFSNNKEKKDYYLSLPYQLYIENPELIEKLKQDDLKTYLNQKSSLINQISLDFEFNILTQTEWDDGLRNINHVIKNYFDKEEVQKHIVEITKNLNRAKENIINNIKCQIYVKRLKENGFDKYNLHKNQKDLLNDLINQSNHELSYLIQIFESESLQEPLKTIAKDITHFNRAEKEEIKNLTNYLNTSAEKFLSQLEIKEKNVTKKPIKKKAI